MLHTHLLATSAFNSFSTSRATLESVVRIAIDIAESHNNIFARSSVDSVPPTCAYVVSAALRNLKSCASGIKQSVAEASHILSTSIAYFDDRWAILNRNTGDSVVSTRF